MSGMIEIYEQSIKINLNKPLELTMFLKNINRCLRAIEKDEEISFGNEDKEAIKKALETAKVAFSASLGLDD